MSCMVCPSSLSRMNYALCVKEKVKTEGIYIAETNMVESNMWPLDIGFLLFDFLPTSIPPIAQCCV